MNPGYQAQVYRFRSVAQMNQHLSHVDNKGEWEALREPVGTCAFYRTSPQPWRQLPSTNIGPLMANFSDFLREATNLDVYV
jgi:hypothetical protein